MPLLWSKDEKVGRKMKTTKEKIVVMQAYDEGKQIQIKDGGYDDWSDWNADYEPNWDWQQFKYRIKPEEPIYRPYESIDEMVEDYCDKSGELRLARLSMPYIWVKYKNKRWGDTKHLLTSFNNACEGHSYVWIANGWVSLEELFDDYTYLNGSPCGKLVE